MKRKLRLKHFPVSFFSVILGLTGFTIAFQKAETVLNFPIKGSFYIFLFTSAVFVLISFVYLLKIIVFWSTVKEEFSNPVRLSFFPTFSISLLLLSIALLEINITLSKYVCVLGGVIHFILTIKVVSIWIRHTHFKIEHMNPAWFIPAVGNILVPISATAHFSKEVSWFFYSVGFLFWLILLVIFFNRIIFHSPLPERLLPTLFILIAPPAIGFIAFVKLTGEVNEFAKILYYFNLFLVILLFSQIGFIRTVKYYISWWAYSFPIAASTIASILMYHETSIEGFKYISFSLFGILSLLICLLLVKTTISIASKEICVEE